MAKRQSTEMKKILRDEYPNAKFKVRKDSGSISRSFTIYTDLIKEHDHQKLRELDRKLSTQGLSQEENKEFEKINKLVKKNKNITKNIKRLLSDYQRVSRDSKTNEILSGGNSFLFIKPWKETKYL